MSDQAKRALEQGRAMVARQKEREAADMQIPSGEGRVFSPAEQAVMDLTSDPKKNVAIVQKAIDDALASHVDPEKALMEQGLREASQKIETLQGELQAARDVNVAAVAAEQAAKAELAALQEKIAGGQGSESTAGAAPTGTPNEGSAPAAGEGAASGDTPQPQ